MTTYLITGDCGTGKTWVMKKIISQLHPFDLKQQSEGLYHWITDGNIYVLGKYDGTTFEGGDRLSMSVMVDNKKVLPLFAGKIVIAEGDRFNNQTFVRDFNPIVLRIKGSGHEGRVLRETEQDERHLLAIHTRVKNMQTDWAVENSEEAYTWIMSQIACPTFLRKPRGRQQDLF